MHMISTTITKAKGVILIVVVAAVEVAAGGEGAVEATEVAATTGGVMVGDAKIMAVIVVVDVEIMAEVEDVTTMATEVVAVAIPEKSKEGEAIGAKAGGPILRNREGEVGGMNRPKINPRSKRGDRSIISRFRRS